MDFFEDIEKCLIQDSFQVETWERIISALASDDEASLNKYLSVNEVLDNYNWTPCVDVENLAETIEKDGAWWTDFWANELAETIFQGNQKRNAADIEEAIITLASSWAVGNAYEAGRAYGRFWALLIGRPDAW